MPSSVSLVIPVYNEARHLEEFLRMIDGLDLSPVGVERLELVFVDDASQDGSLEILRKFSFRSRVQILSQERNAGKGAALHRGIQAATSEIIAIQDADFEYDARDLLTLVEPLVREDADVVYGSRFRKNGYQVHRTFHYMVNRFLTVLSNFLSGLYLTDMETCYKVFRRDVIQNIRLTSKRFGFEPEVTAKLGRLKVRIQEFPIRYFPRNYLEGKKIRWTDGVAAVWHIVRFNLLQNPRDAFAPELPERYRVSGTQWL
jgi:glycosyltransferase involved in cell wall biosynthesis